ncbi:GIY-YIG nuclease family protein [Mastigocladopsis repens]|uniref:GIY-YIG nuclease family protein n=1 Tax=Mastigocladopsis repens TaxID=221287 RepID=UPI0002E146EE|nr:GIY-YIG nuclease family protein [Mastigocladopsis repens]
MSRFLQRREYRDDHVPGYIYLMRAKGYHGLVPGCYLQRCKIGLSRNPEARLQTFIDNQPPCDIEIIKTIYVEDMEFVETTLHQRFKHCNVRLVKSREWFDLNPWQYAMVLWAFSRYESRRLSFENIPVRVVVGGLVALLGMGMLVGQSMREPQVQPSVEAIPGQR